MLNQLQEIPELCVSIDINEDKLKDIKDPVATLTKYDFFRCYSDMIDRIERIGLDENLEQAGLPTELAEENFFSDKKDEFELMNIPLPGKSGKDHVRD